MGTVSVNSALTIVSADSSANTAKVKYVVKCITAGDSFNEYTQTGTFIIDGTEYTKDYSLPAETTTTVFDKTVTVNNASGRTIKASYSFPTTPYYGTQTGSDSVKIPVLVETPEIESLTLKTKGLNSLKFAYTLKKATDKIFYKLSTNSNYTQIATNSKSGEFIVSNLDPNKNYTINFLARNTNGSTNKDATKNISATTYDIAKITEAPDIIHGDNLELNISNPASANLNLSVEIDNTQIINKTVTTGNNSVELSDDELDSIYKKYGKNNSVSLNYVLTTNSNSSWKNETTVICTLKGNQKTRWKNVNGTWKRCVRWKNVNGMWKRCVRWKNVNGIWKRCI